MKRTLDELALRYQLGGSTSTGRDVYVEGIQDKVILDHVFEVAGFKASVYTSDTVCVPNQILLSRGLEAPSARSVIVATREELAQRGVDVGGHFFLVDRDQEDLVPTPCINGCTTTDFGCLPAHLVTQRSLEKLTRLIGRRRISLDDLRQSIFSISKELYLMRGAAKRLGLPVRFLPPSHYIGRGAFGCYELDLESYLDACLHSVGLIVRRLDMLAAIEGCRGEIESRTLDGRVFVNDHELWVIVRAILRDNGDGVNRSEDDIRDLFVMAVDERDLEESLLFQSLFAQD